MKKLFVFLFVTFALSCNQSKKCNISNSCLSNLDSSLDSTFIDTLNTSMQYLFGYDFDEYMFVPPYADLEITADRLQIDMDCVEKTNIKDLDHFYVICLLKNKKIIQTCIVSRANIELYEVNRIELLSAQNDSIMIYREGKKIFIRQNKLFVPEGE